MKIFIFSLLAFSFYTQSALAFKNKIFGLGLGYYSQNALNTTSQTDSGSSSFLGEPNYPLNFTYDIAMSAYWFLGQQLGYTLLARSSAGKTADVSLLYYSVRAGTNLSTTNGIWDWFLGPGFMQEEIKGKGGTTEINNGTSTAIFAIPGKSSIVNKIFLDVGTSWSISRNRLGFEVIVENPFSSTKRAQSLLFSYAYLFGDGATK